MEALSKYRKRAFKLATTKYLGKHDGYVARIPVFRGLLAVGSTKSKALLELKSALKDWTDLALLRGIGLPNLGSL